MPWVTLPDGTRAHLLIRGRPGKVCSSCAAFPAPVDCDGCDRPTCEDCTVSPRDELDFCPSCARPVFLHYLNSHGGRAVYEGGGKQAGRGSFREWARANVAEFLSRVKRTDASLAREAKESMKRKVIDVSQSPMNALRWLVKLECGHEAWLTRKKKPAQAKYTCLTCAGAQTGTP
jgi:hypothetical protein